MPIPYTGELRLFSWAAVPNGWIPCNGQLLSIKQYTQLFSLLSTTYGGDGVTTFALPNLQGRVPIHASKQFPLGSAGGEETHTLTNDELPQHAHPAIASSNTADQISSANNFWANGSAAIFTIEVETIMARAAVAPVGGSHAHNNLSPYLTLNVCIAFQGDYPQRS